MNALPRFVLFGWALATGLGASALASSSAAAAAAEDEELTPALRDWHKGPVRWLIEPREIRAYRRIDDRAEALAFIRAFWRRRDPTPGDEDNPFADEFSRRLDMADRMYTEESARGSLTDRGGALILLGAPTTLRVFRRRSPQVRLPGRAASGAVSEVEIEQWVYRAEDLRFLDPTRGEAPVLTFVRRPKETRLSRGGDLLLRAARAAIVGR
jgi:GWxTD domain-containing protein